FSSDIWSSCVVLIGLILVAVGIKGADSFAAIGVAIFVLTAAYRLGKKTIDVLIDTAPEGITDIVREIVSNIEGIISIEKIRVRPLGSSVFIEVEININRGFSTIKTNEIVKRTREAIQQKIKDSDILIHTNSIQLKDETMIDIVRTVSFKHALSVHSIIVDRLNDRKYISYDLELPGDLTVFEAHEIASHLEKEIQSEISTDIELITHIDPHIIEEKISEKLSDKEILSIEKIVRESILNIGIIKNAHDISIRRIGENIFITLHCYAKAEEKIEKAHQSASKLKSLIKEKIKNVQNVVVHVEPETKI
ncbi:MAG: cation transporter dimerization domain-containing protein, partial [bacterium]